MIFFVAFAIIIGHSQTTSETLFKKYIVKRDWKASPVISYSVTYEDKSSATFLYTPDTLINGNFFFSIGVCISSYDPPFHFIKTSYIPIINNSVFDYKKTILLNIDLVNDNYDHYNVKAVSKMKSEEFPGVVFQNMELKNNCNIFILTTEDFLKITKYRIRSIQLEKEGMSSRIVAGIYNNEINIISDRISKISITPIY